MPIPKLDRLKSILMTSGLQTKDPPLFQVIHTLIEFLRTAQIATTTAIATVSGGSGFGTLSLSSLLGRGDSGAGAAEEITIGSGLLMTGTTLSATGGGGGSGITVYEQSTEPMAAVMGDFWIVT